MVTKRASLYRLERRAVVASLLERRGELLVVTGLGSANYDVHAAGDHPATYYLWGAMGGAAMVGLGLALAQPQRHVLVITGDGEQLMGLGSLATIGAVARPRNLSIVVIDNGHFGETGMQRSHTGFGVDVAAIARACGFEQALTIDDLPDVVRLRESLASEPGPRLALIRVSPNSPPRSLSSRDAVQLKNRFRAFLGVAEP
jgi:thiamine pyrophosphate-dependent acetolactate synthase large subunit-like protein